MSKTTTITHRYTSSSPTKVVSRTDPSMTISKENTAKAASVHVYSERENSYSGPNVFNYYMTKEQLTEFRDTINECLKDWNDQDHTS